MRYEILNTAEALERCKPLFLENWEESGQHDQPFELDKTIYEMLAPTGSFAIAVWDGDELAGYAVVIISSSTHTSRQVAYNDTIYVRPKYRSGGLGGRLFFMAERVAKERGAELFQWAVNPGSPLQLALEKRPHGMVQFIYEREL